MKKSLQVLALGALLIPGLALAHGGYGHGSRLDAMAEHFNLTDAQKEQVKTIFDEQRAKRRALRDETRNRLAEVLTPEQLEEMEQMRRHGPYWGWHRGYGPHRGW